MVKVDPSVMHVSFIRENFCKLPENGPIIHGHMPLTAKGVSTFCFGIKVFSSSTYKHFTILLIGRRVEECLLVG